MPLYLVRAPDGSELEHDSGARILDVGDRIDASCGGCVVIAVDEPYEALLWLQRLQ